MGHWQEEQSQLARRRRSIPPLSPSTTRPGARSDGRRWRALLGLLCLSCASGQIGGEVGYNADASLETFGSCEAVSEERVDAGDPNLGFDVARLLARLDGASSRTTLAFGQGLPSSFTLTPEPGQSSVRVDIAVVPGSTRQIERAPASDGTSTTNAAPDEADDTCAPVLAFDAHVTFTLENGAIDGTFAAVFVASSADWATSAFDVKKDALGDAFTLDYDGEAGSDLDLVRIQLAWVDGQLSGKLVGQVTGQRGEVSAVIDLAGFPADGCTFGHDLPADSDLTAGARDAVAALEHFELSWPNESTTELSLEHEFGQVCLTPRADVTELTLATTAAARTADGKLDGVWSLAASVDFDQDGNAVSVELERAGALMYDPGAFAEQTGIQGIEVDPAVAATFVLRVHGDTSPATGTLTVLESRPSACDLPPDEPADVPGAGGVEPGCAGQVLTEVGTATLTARE